MSVKQMLEAADAAVPRINPAQAQEMIAKGNALVVDVRDPPEVADNRQDPRRDQLRADPETPHHDKNSPATRHSSFTALPAALAGKVLKDMCYVHVYNLGAFKVWIDSVGAVER